MRRIQSCHSPLPALLLAFLSCVVDANCGTPAVDYGSFLARHDLRWERTPTAWFEAPFLGNGLLGTMLYQGGPQTVRLEVGRGDAYDHRKEDGAWHNRCRLPIGYFTLETVGTIRSFTGRLTLWDAEFSGEVTTDKGSIRLRSFVHATRVVMIFDVAASGSEQGCRLVWHPAEAVAPARAWAIEKLKHDPGDGLARQWAEMKYESNPPFQTGREGAIEFCYQPLLEGGETCTSWRIDNLLPGHQRLFVSVAHTYPQATARVAAVAAVRSATEAGFDALVRTHREWWHAYYPESFVAIPDPYWEGFYWIQMYKLASATRADGALIDTMGPWFQPTVWPCVWFNLNVQSQLQKWIKH